MKLIVGLGNPGRKYRDTRHNVGFEVLAEIHRRHSASKPAAKFDSEVAEFWVADEKVILQSPLTYMNNSGRAVRAATDFYKLMTSDVLIVCDDFNLTLGRIRFRPTGSAGGQNGLKDIIRSLGTDQIARLRIGIGHPPQKVDVSDYVLSRFREDERAEMQNAIQRAADGTELWIRRGIEECMNTYNSDPNRESAMEPAGEPPKPVKITDETPGDAGNAAER